MNGTLGEVNIQGIRERQRVNTGHLLADLAEHHGITSNSFKL
jgi:hypothetical protein